MKNKFEKSVEEKLDTVVELLRLLAAIELNGKGVKHEVIGKQLHVAKAKVGQMLKGVEKGGGTL